MVPMPTHDEKCSKRDKKLFIATPPKQSKQQEKQNIVNFIVFFSLRSFLHLFFKIDSLFDSHFTPLDGQFAWSTKL